ncbi:MAG: hypothetical protein WC955_01000 [Elusimicrobiota bacterium]
MKNIFLSILKLVLLLYILLQSITAYCAIPTGINYQGRYRENGVYITGNRAFLFKITDSGGTSEYWRSGIVNLRVESGLYHYVLNFSTGLNWVTTTPHIEVSAGPEGSTEPQLISLTPRELIVGAPYAFYTSTAIYSQKTGVGTVNYVAKFTATDQLGNSSSIYDNGNVAIGNTSPANKLDIEGNCAVGATYAGTSAGPANGLIIEGSVGIGLTNPQNKLDVEGAAAIGATYAGTSAGPSNGLIVEGKVGIGITNPSGTLEIQTGSGNTYALKISSSNGTTEIMSVKHSGTISGFGIAPIGSIVAWHKSLSGVPSLPAGWVECTGGTVSDVDSPINGQAIPDLNSEKYAGGRGLYLRGGTTSGSFNESTRYSGNGTKYAGQSGTYYGAAYAQWNDTENGALVTYSTTDNTLGYPYIQVTAMTMVWIMKTK